MDITSPHNSRIAAVRKLDLRKHREQQGRFLVVGLQLLHMALEAGHCADEVYYCPELCAEHSSLLERFRACGAQIISATSAVMEEFSPRNIVPPMVATFPLFEQPMATIALSGHGLVIVLDRLQDAGNLGTLLRTADAVGVEAVALLEPCVDVFDPRAIRASMGSLFNLPIMHTANAEAVVGRLAQAGYRVLGADVREGRLWGEGLWDGGVALVLGSEGQGLSEDVRGYIKHYVCLPMVGKAESLNVSVAGGALMYAWLKVNHQV